MRYLVTDALHPGATQFWAGEEGWTYERREAVDYCKVDALLIAHSMRTRGIHGAQAVPTAAALPAEIPHSYIQ